MIATPELLMERARDRACFSDFGPAGWRLGLEQLVAAVDVDIGQDTDTVPRIEELIIERLVKRLRIEQWYAKHAAEAAVPIERIIVIVGLPRTATTALHYLLAVDPRFRYLRRWELDDPVPPPDHSTEAEDPRRPGDTDHGDVQHIRTIGGPAEDGPIHELCFDNGETVLPVPSYTAWWRAAEHSALFPYHERVLRMLHSRRPPRTWLLKSPAYLFDLTQLASHYPNAQFVVTHRDPAVVLPSTCSTVLASRRRRLPRWSGDLCQFGRDMLCHWVDGVERAAAARALLGENRFLDVAQRLVDTDPIGTAERVYDFLGIDLAKEVRTAMERWSTSNRPGSRGEHEYRSADFGLAREEIRDAFARYIETFGDYC